MDDNWVVGTLVVFVVIIVFKVITKFSKTTVGYNRIPSLFSEAERSFLGILTQVIGQEFRVFGKVRVADILSPKKGMNRSNWQRAFNKISSKHFDYVLCDNSDLRVLCVIELDDVSHRNSSRQRRDNFLESACDSAGLPLVRVKAARSYSLQEISDLIATAIGDDTQSFSRG